MEPEKIKQFDTEPEVFPSAPLTALFESFKAEYKTRFLKKYQDQDDVCFYKNAENQEHYAKCLLSLEKSFEESKRYAGFKINFVHKKIKECINSKLYRRNHKEGEAYCTNQANQYVKQILDSV